MGSLLRCHSRENGNPETNALDARLNTPDYKLRGQASGMTKNIKSPLKRGVGVCNVFVIPPYQRGIKGVVPPFLPAGRHGGKGRLGGIWTIFFILFTIILSSAIPASADTANFSYDDANRVVREEYGEKTASTPSPKPNISVSSVSWNYGDIDVTESSTPQTFTLSNTGTSNLTVNSITLTGDNASEFVRSNDNCTGKTIAPSSSCTVQVTFSPTSSGAKTANLSIVSNDPGKPTFEVKLIGTGIDQEKFTITSSAGSNGTIDPLGTVTVKSGTSQTFTITPNSEYQVEDVTVDGVSRGSITTYTFSGVAADHTIKATFSTKVENREKICK
jgi:hypothetical protein